MNKTIPSSARLMPGAHGSRHNKTDRILNAAYAIGALVLQTEFNIDPECPFFYIYAGGQNALATQAFRLDAIFSNGGTPVSEAQFFWGANLPALIPKMTVCAIIESPTIMFHDPVSGVCPFIRPTSDTGGLCSRWSAIANKLVMKITALSAYSSDLTIGCGYLQQPWAI